VPLDTTVQRVDAGRAGRVSPRGAEKPPAAAAAAAAAWLVMWAEVQCLVTSFIAQNGNAEAR